MGISGRTTEASRFVVGAAGAFFDRNACDNRAVQCGFAGPFGTGLLPAELKRTSTTPSIR